jgi:hypothetical protein
MQRTSLSLEELYTAPGRVENRARGIGDFCTSSFAPLFRTRPSPLTLTCLLPSPLPSPTQTAESEGRFCSLDQIFDVPLGSDLALLRRVVEPTVGLVCDGKEIGGDTYYRLNDTKVRKSVNKKRFHVSCSTLGCSYYI